MLGLLSFCCVFAQRGENVQLKIINNRRQPLTNTTVELLSKDSSLLKIGVSDSTGLVEFKKVLLQKNIFRVSSVGYETSVISFEVSAQNTMKQIILQPAANTLDPVMVSARKLFIELHPDKTIINLEAGIANVGTTVMEALEKLPGVTIDKDGNISLKGRSNVLLMLDGKPTYLNGAELATLLTGMSASQITQVELMDNPSAKFDAAGNAGVINIKTKKNDQRGLNGSITTSLSQGYYPKSNNNFSVNYRSGKINVFASYSLNTARYFTRIYALRTYFKNDGTSTASLLEQPSFIKGEGTTHTLRTGIDYSFNKKTSVGLTLSGLTLKRNTIGNNSALWMRADKTVDSLIATKSDNITAWDNAGAALNFKHSFTSTKELTANIDFIGYRIRSNQFFENNSVIPGNYSEAFRAEIPADIHILSARADYSEQLKNVKLEGGWKSSRITTDNLSAYMHRDGITWREDLGKSNNFLYEETINALYGAAETKLGKLSLQSGLRYEMTGYDANQLGNSVVKDSSFSRKYNSLFPSLSISYEKDSSHTFSISASRRIDRPAFQKLNPFLFIINKYTYQQGNPFYRPQFTWNLALKHLYKNVLITGISYSVTKDYFSQIFLLDSNAILIYTEGNLGRLQNLGVSVGLQLTPSPWWSFSLQTVLNRKKMEGVLASSMVANITQYQINLNNQFRFKKGWSGEVSGFYNSTSQQDIQEIVDPAGQLSVGISKTVLQNKGSLKLAVRDVLYTNWMKGLTYLYNATEYFKVTRDTRVVTLSFTWRFGKLFKATKHSEGAARDEVQRVGNE
ncbi:MAG: TonB-dependent receptor [Flavisolibacter sp.]|nr:TonB-dependent receptor [Flavisolibacter sp.]